MPQTSPMSPAAHVDKGVTLPRPLMCCLVRGILKVGLGADLRRNLDLFAADMVVA